MTAFDTSITFDSDTLVFGGYQPVPAPTPEIPVADPTDITYVFSDNLGSTLAILPLTGFTFDLVLNSAGQWSGTLPVEDPNVQQTNWIEATAPNKTCIWVYSGSTLVYGGRVLTRRYTMSQQKVRLGGADFVSYLDQRLQAFDYSTVWNGPDVAAGVPAFPASGQVVANNQSFAVGVSIQGVSVSSVRVNGTVVSPTSSGYYMPEFGNIEVIYSGSGGTWTWVNTSLTGIASAAKMATKMIYDAMQAANSLPIEVQLLGASISGGVVEEIVPPDYWIFASFPLSQQQTLASLVQQLQQMGYLVGFDYACDVYQAAGGNPVPFISLSYPRRGMIAGESELTLDMSTAIDLVWDEDGTSQADQVQEMATWQGGVGATLTWDPALSVHGYPLLQSINQHAVFSAQTFYTNSEVSASQPILNAWGADDLELHAYPSVAPKITVPLYAPGLSLGDFNVGDDIRIVLSTSAGIPVNPRFPNGLDVYMRIVRCSVKIKDEGLSVMELTLNVPPSSTPQLPPQ